MREDCDRFRVIASLQPDGELTRLEAARHAEHAARCHECSAYAYELAAITARIRATPLAPVALRAPQQPPGRRRGLRPAGHLAAALAVGLLIASGFGDSGPETREPTREAASLQAIDDDRRLLRLLRRPSAGAGGGLSKAI
ncbi:MAG: hypothetical protein ACXWZ8_04940 [Gaiellaceae bacterium]